MVFEQLRTDPLLQAVAKQVLRRGSAMGLTRASDAID